MFIEQRRRGLVRFLEFVGRHPVLRNDETIITFLREENNDAFASFKKLKAAQVIEELSFNPIALSSKEHTPVDADDALRAAREKVPSLILTFAKYVETVESMVKRIQGNVIYFTFKFLPNIRIGDAVDYMKMGQLQQYAPPPVSRSLSNFFFLGLSSSSSTRASLSTRRACTSTLRRASRTSPRSTPRMYALQTLLI